MKPTPSQRQRRSTLVLGLLLAVMAGVSGVLAFGGSHPDATVAASPATVAQYEIVPEKTGANGAMSMTGAIELAGRPETACSLANPAACGEPWEGAYDVDSLPAWRWRDLDLDKDTSGGWSKAVQNAFNQVPVTIAEMIFHAANFVWMLLLFLMKMGFDAKGLLGIGAQSINNGAAFMADKLIYFIIPLSAYVMWKFFRDFLKLRSGNPIGLMRRVVVFSVLIGMMWMVASSSQQAVLQNADDTDAQLEYVGTIPWMAKEVLNFGDKIVSPIAGVVIDVDPDGDTESADQTIAGEQGDLAAGPAQSAEETAARSTAGGATCEAYIRTIHANYARAEDAERSLIIVSRLWEGTFYQALKSASFGEPTSYRDPETKLYYPSDIPDRVMCHYMESVNGTDVEVQQKIARAAYGAAAVPEWSGLAASPLVYVSGDANNKDSQRKAMGAWAACKWNGSAWVGQPEFAGAWASSGSENVYTDDGGALCLKAMVEPGDEWGDDWGDKFYIFGSQVTESTGEGNAEHRAQLQAARTWALGYSGANAGGRMIGAFIAFIVSLLFLYSFGLLGLGLTISMMIAVALLALALPAALVLGAIGKNRQAAPLFKMTLFSLLGHAFLTLLLSVIVIISGIFQNLFSSLPGLPLMIRSLTSGLAPVIAFVVVRKVLKSVGMGDILSPTGALSFAGAAALKGGGKMSADAQKRMAGGDTLKKTPGLGKRLDRLDGRAPTWKNWSPEGRRKRLEANAKQDAAERKKRLARIDERNNKTADKRREQLAAQMRLNGEDPTTDEGRAELERRYQESLAAKPLRKGRISKKRDDALNKLDKFRAPGSLTDRLKELDYKYSDSARDLGHDAMNYPVKLATQLGLGIAQRRIANAGRPPGTAVSADVAPDTNLDLGDALSGPGTTESRTEAVRVVGDTIAAKGGINSGTAFMLNSVAAVHTGRGFNTDGLPVVDLLSDGGRDALRVSAAIKFGVDPSMVLSAPTGLVMPVPVSGEDRRNLENSAHGLGHFAHALPEEDKKRRTFPAVDDDGNEFLREESDSEFCARVTVMGVMRGGIMPDGSIVDMRSVAYGDADMSNPDVLREIDDWGKGKPNARLDNFVLQATHPDEEKMIQAAYELVRQQERVVVVREAGPVEIVDGPAARLAASGFTLVTRGNHVSAETARREAAAGPTSVFPQVPSTVDGTLLETTKQMLVALNAIKENFANAKAVGDTQKVGPAAQKMSQVMEMLDAHQERLVENLGNVLADNFERQLAAQQLQDREFTENFGEIFDDGVERIAETVGTVTRALDSFKQGTLGLAGVIQALDKSMKDTVAQQRTSVDNLQNVLSTMETEAGQRLRDARTGQAAYRTPSARDVATSSGATGVPDETDEGKR
jgi:hypothetical protein